MGKENKRDIRSLSIEELENFLFKMVINRSEQFRFINGFGKKVFTILIL